MQEESLGCNTMNYVYLCSIVVYNWIIIPYYYWGKLKIKGDVNK